MKKTSKLLYLLLLLLISSNSNAITISVNSVCSIDSKSYNFDSYDYTPDYKIRISSYSLNPDFVFKEVLNKNDADIVIEDNGDNGDIIVCKSENDRTIKMLNYEYGADLIVIISDYHYSPDYTIFHNSKILSLKEAIAITVFQDYEFNE